MVIKYKF